MRPGDIVAGKYRVTRVLGRSRGFLLEARHTEFDQHVVIRLMSPSLCDEKELERFRREARTLSKLESEYSARIIDVGTHSDGSFFLVRQFLEGQDLGTHLRNQGALRLDQAVSFILQAGEVVQECHSHNIVLREMQPSHLFIAQKRGGAGSLKVIDFGTAKVLKGPGGGNDDPDNQSTAIFGISNYWSPEMVRKGAVDPRTDVWSLGCIFYEMLSAVPAFSGEMAELMLKISRDDPMPITRLRPDLPRELDQIINWALAKDPNSRFASVYAFAHALRPFATPEGQLLVDQIGRIAHAAPAVAAEVAVSPTSPLAAGASSLLDDDDEGSSTVIMHSPLDDNSESDLEKTSFMHDSPFAAMALPPSGRASIPSPQPSNRGGIPSDPYAAAGVPQATPSFSGAFQGQPAPAAPSGGGAKWGLVAAGVLVPVLGIAGYFALNKKAPVDGADASTKTSTTASPSATASDPVAAAATTDKPAAAAVAPAEIPPADTGSASASPAAVSSLRAMIGMSCMRVP